MITREKIKKDKRGGARKGAGRKRKPKADKVVRIETWHPASVVESAGGKEAVKEAIYALFKRV